MRSWPAPLEQVERELRTPWRARMGGGHGLRELVRVEIGLYLLENLGLAHDLQALAAVISGYELPLERGAWSERERQLTASARHLLTYFKGGFAWRRAVEAYSGLPEDLVGYRVDELRRMAERRRPSLAAKRWAAYEQALTGSIPYATEPRLEVAGPGRYRAGSATVVIPEGLVLPTGPEDRSHGLARHSPHALRVRWDELVSVASGMDAVSSGDWARRLGRVRLELRCPDQTFGDSEELLIDRQLHLAGMVSSGKSTLMHVLAGWAVRKGLHVTLVVGTVIEALDLSTEFRGMGLAAVPILGVARGAHLERMHKFLARRSSVGPLEQNDPSFSYLSSACPLDALRVSGERFTVGTMPCRDVDR